MNDCPICDQIPQRLPMTGTFDLLSVGPGDVFDFYDIRDVAFEAEGYVISGNGRYQISPPHIAGLQFMRLDAAVNKEVGIVMASDMVPLSTAAAFPEIDIELAEQTQSITRVYRLRILAAPIDMQFRPDLDHDGDVDQLDLDLFRGCATGPDIPYNSAGLPPGCTLKPDGSGRIAADLDADNDIDQDDFGIFQRCYSGAGKPADPNCAADGPHITETWRSECKPGDPAADDGYPWCGEDELDVVVHGHILQVSHRDAVYNCCLDEIEVTLEVDGQTLRFVEKERLAAPCDCLCCYNVTTTVGGLKPGVYTIAYCWEDDESGHTCLTKDLILPP